MEMPFGFWFKKCTTVGKLVFFFDYHGVVPYEFFEPIQTVDKGYYLSVKRLV